MDPISPSSAPLRILHCIATLSGGGAENQLATLCETANPFSSDFIFHVAHLRSGIHLERIAQTRAVTHRLSLGPQDPRIIFALAEIVRRHQIDVIQTWLPAMDVWGGLAAQMSQRPFLISERSGAECYPSGWKSTLRRFSGKRAAAIVANSTAGLEYWQSLVRPERLVLIPNAIDGSRLASALPLTPEEEALSRATRHLIVFAGRLTEAKNLDVLCDACALVLDARRDVSVLFFGEGELHDQVQHRLRGMDPDRIRLMGYTGKLPSWLRAASLFVSLSRFEGQPNVVLEAACLRVPQVLSDIPQHRETLGTNGAFFTPVDSPALAAATMLACLDSPLRGEKVAAAQAAVAALTPQRILARYHDLYRALTQKTPS